MGKCPTLQDNVSYKGELFSYIKASPCPLKYLNFMQILSDKIRIKYGQYSDKLLKKPG